MTHLPGTPVDIPIPPMLEQAIGYEGQANFYALYWTPGGDEATYSDGHMTADGQWTAYLAFIDHPAVALVLGSWAARLGGSDVEATHWLVIDRAARQASVAPIREASAFLHAQWPRVEEPPMRVLSPDEFRQLLDRLNERLRRVPQLTVDQVHALIEGQDELNQQMRAWLDTRLPPDWQQRVYDEQRAAVEGMFKDIPR